MTKKDYIVIQLRSLLGEIKIDDQCLYDIVSKDVVKNDTTVELTISHRSEIIAIMTYNKVKGTVVIESCGRTNGHVWSTTEEFKYNQELTKEDASYIKWVIHKIMLQAVEVVTANRNQIELGTIDM